VFSINQQSIAKGYNEARRTIRNQEGFVMVSRTKVFMLVLLILSLIILLPVAVYAADGIVFEFMGTDPPPSTLGGFQLIAAQDSTLPDFSVITSLQTIAGPIEFDSGGVNIEVRSIPDTWGTWSQGYTRPIYYLQRETLTLELPPHVKAFLIYLQPVLADYIPMGVQINDGPVYTEEVYGLGGASGFGFYSTDDETIDTVHITYPYDHGFAFAQIYLGFGIDEILTLQETGADLLPEFLALYEQILADMFPGHTVTDVTLSSPGHSALIDPGTYDAVLTFKVDGMDMRITVPGGMVITPRLTPPTIIGPTTLTLTEGYAATATGVYTVTGSAPVIVTLSGNTGGGAITWNAATKQIDIAAGLPVGTYTVTLTASNNVAPDAVATFTLTIVPAVPATGDVSSVVSWLALGGSAFVLAILSPAFKPKR